MSNSAEDFYTWFKNKLKGLDDRGLVARLASSPTLQRWLMDVAENGFLRWDLNVGADFSPGLLDFHLHRSVYFPPFILGGVAIGAALPARRVSLAHDDLTLAQALVGTAGHRPAAGPSGWRGGEWRLELPKFAPEMTECALAVGLDDGTFVAAGTVKRCVEVAAADERVLLEQAARAQFDLHRWEESLLLWKLYGKLYPDDLFAWQEAARILILLGQYSEALALMQEAAKRVFAEQSPSVQIQQILSAAADGAAKCACFSERYLAMFEVPGATAEKALDTLRTLSVDEENAFKEYCQWRIYRKHPYDYSVLSALLFEVQFRNNELRRFIQRKIADVFPDRPAGAQAWAELALLDQHFGRIVERYIAAGRAPETPLTALVILQALLAQREREGLRPKLQKLSELVSADIAFAGVRELIAGYLAHDLGIGCNSHPVKSPPAQKPRVALCLSGYFRGYQQVLPTLKRNVVDRYQAKVFCSAWTESEVVIAGGSAKDHLNLPCWLKNSLPQELGAVDFAEAFPRSYECLAGVKEVSAVRLQRVLPGVAVEVESEEQFEAAWCSSEDSRSWRDAKKFYYKLQQVLKMMAAYEARVGALFDYVIWARADIVFDVLAIPPFQELQAEIVFDWMEANQLGEYLMVGSRDLFRLLAQLWTTWTENSNYLTCLAGKEPYLQPHLATLIYHGITPLNLSASGVSMAGRFSGECELPKEFSVALGADIGAMSETQRETYGDAVRAFFEHYAAEKGVGAAAEEAGAVHV